MKSGSLLLGFVLLLSCLFLSTSCKCGSGLGFHKKNVNGGSIVGDYAVPHRIIGECSKTDDHSFIAELNAADAQDIESTYQALIASLVSGSQAKRVKQVSRSYNSHGLSLDGRNSSIDNKFVKDVLRKAGYSDIQGCSVTSPIKDDIAVYQYEGVVVHSGIVIEEIVPNVTRIVSKWADGPEYEHDLHVFTEAGMYNKVLMKIFYYRENCD